MFPTHARAKLRAKKNTRIVTRVRRTPIYTYVYRFFAGQSRIAKDVELITFRLIRRSYPFPNVTTL